MMRNATTRVLIGGDICPVRRGRALLSPAGPEAVLTDLIESFRRADLVIGNLECPLIDRPSPVAKIGPGFGAPAETAARLRDAGFDVLGLANNHILDHGPAGLRSTLGVCREAGVSVVGAGENLAEASAPLLRRIGDLRLAILAMADRESSVTDNGCPGASPADPLRFVRTMRVIRGQFDFLIVLLHAGNEFYPYPSPRLRDLCQFLVEEGASVVVCQHSHCPGCIEFHHGGAIVYGQGNLLFDMHPHREGCWYEGFVVDLRIRGAAGFAVETIPYRQFDDAGVVRRLRGPSLAAFQEALERRSRDLLRPGFIEDSWRRFCSGQRDEYLSYLSGHGRLLRFVNRRLRLASRLRSGASMMLSRAVVRSEAHREVLETVLAESGCPPR